MILSTVIHAWQRRSSDWRTLPTMIGISRIPEAATNIRARRSSAELTGIEEVSNIPIKSYQGSINRDIRVAKGLVQQAKADTYYHIFV